MNALRFYMMLAVAVLCCLILVTPQLLHTDSSFFTVSQSGKWGEGNLRTHFTLLKTDEAPAGFNKDTHIMVRLKASFKADSKVNLNTKKLSCSVRCQGITLFEIPVFDAAAGESLRLVADREQVFEVSQAVPKGLLKNPKVIDELLPGGSFSVASTYLKEDMFMTNLSPVDIPLP